MKRRKLLTAISSGAVLLAGCAATRPPGTGDDDRNGDDDSSNGSDDIDASIEHRWSDCGGPDDDSILPIANDAITIIGVTPAPNPCHEATIEEITLEDGELSAIVGVESTLEADEECIQCHGAVGYRLTIDVSPDDVETVVVDHEEGERHEETPISGEDVPGVVDTTIETVETGCWSSDDEEGVEVEISGDEVVIAGVRPAPNPCHIATIVDTRVEEDRLEVSIDVESDLDEGEVCIECTGVVTYEARIEVEGAELIDEIAVDHVNAGDHVVRIDQVNEVG